MITTPEWRSPQPWSVPHFSLDSFSLVFLPGGHEKGVRQVIDSPVIQRALGDYFPQTRKPSKKSAVAICHGVMALCEGKTADGKSVLHDATTTALPGTMEGVAYHGTRLFLGDYYKTYGAGSETVEEYVGLHPPITFQRLNLRLTILRFVRNSMTTRYNTKTASA